MFRQIGSIVGIVVGLVGLLSGCNSKPVVGVILPTTGAAASYGESIESGVRLALSDARKRDQLPEGFEIHWADSGSDPARAAAELQKMVSEHDVKLVIGGATSAEAIAMLPVLDDLRVVCLSPSASAPGLAQRSKYFFRIYPSDELEGHTAANFLFDKLEQTRLLMLTGDTEYTRGILPEFLKQYEESLGGEIVASIAVDEDGWQQRATDAISDGGIGAAYIVGYAEEILEGVIFLRERGFSGRIVTTSAFYIGDVIREAGEAAVGILFPLPPFDRTSEKEPVLSFVNRYTDAYPRAPDVFAAHGYDAMQLTIEALRFAKPPETLEILKAFNYGVAEMMGVTGPILFDDHGDVKHYPQMFIVQEGQVLTYQRYLDVERKRILHQVQDLLAAGE